ncbi:type II toxin-antitoxin system RelE/ParE family toxin [Janthinobacterium sp. BJB446]|uniref:type II toxin-antitoxin system RelE/ParE family toxin n=1 Tax=Janthinobacterium sp. BJB446 TaxID=2048009 RepID=UPI003F8CFC4B
MILPLIFLRLWTNMMYEIRHYLTSSGRDLYTEWLKRQRDNTARVAIVRRVLRMIAGNFGDHKFCHDGVWELRIDVGPGYRVYYAIADGQIILLLCGGASAWRQAHAAERYRIRLCLLARLEGERT